MWRSIVSLNFLLFALATTHAQVSQHWTQKSLAGDTSTAGESSAAVAMDSNYMFVADNEHETLRLFQRFPVTSCVDPVYSTNMRPWLNLTSTNPEDDIEAAVKLNIGGINRIYWLGSHSNSKSGGNLRPNRDRLFATQVNGSGSGSPPYSIPGRAAPTTRRSNARQTFQPISVPKARCCPSGQSHQTRWCSL